MWWKYVGCLLRDVGEKSPCGGMKYQTDLGSFRIITSQCVAEKIDVVDRFWGVVDKYTHAKQQKMMKLCCFKVV